MRQGDELPFWNPEGLAGDNIYKYKATPVGVITLAMAYIRRRHGVEGVREPWHSASSDHMYAQHVLAAAGLDTSPGLLRGALRRPRQWEVVPAAARRRGYDLARRSYCRFRRPRTNGAGSAALILGSA